MAIKVLILTGATGIGKSATSIRLAKKFDMEIISADSVQVFKEFDIGSAKMTKDEMQGIIHHGIDIVSANQEFSVSDFVYFAKEKIYEISAKGKTPFIVGGTGLYIKALVEGFNFGGTQKHENFRKELEDLADKEGLDALYDKLKVISEELANKTDKNNKVRLIRSLEIATFGEEKSKSSPVEFDFKIISLSLQREKLYNRINLRCQAMIEQGLIEETKSLYEKFGECQPMRAIGYKEVLPYLNGEITKEEMLNIISQHTRNYAKRQLTFLRGMQNINYYDIEEKDYYESMEEEIEKWLKI